MLEFVSRPVSLACCCIIVLMGCDKKIEEILPETRTGTAHGKVFLKGQPLTGGELNLFAKETGASASCLIGPDGTFEFGNEIPIGTYSVAANPYGEPGEESGKEIPASLGFPEYSTVIVNIAEGDNELTIEFNP